MESPRRPMEPFTPRSRLANSFQGPQWYHLAQSPTTGGGTERLTLPTGGYGQASYGPWNGQSPRRPQSVPGSARRPELLATYRSTQSSAMRSTVSRGDPEAEARLEYAARRQRMKKLCESLVDPRTGTIKADDLRKSAQWAGLQLPPEVFDSAYAERYASEGETTPRKPGAIKWKNFHAAIDYAKMQNIQGYLQRQQEREADNVRKAQLIRETAQAVEAAKAAAERVRFDLPKKAAAKKYGDVSDAEIRRAHAMIKNKLSLQYGDLRRAFRSFDKDYSGKMTIEEAHTLLSNLNLPIPDKHLRPFTALADLDGDGEVDFPEFARILSADDPLDMKDTKQAAPGSHGIADASKRELRSKANPDVFPGVTAPMLRTACATVRDKLLTKHRFVTDAFRNIDQDSSGTISCAELAKFLDDLNIGLSTQVKKALVDMSDDNGDGSINYRELAKILTIDDPLDAAPLRWNYKSDKRMANGVGAMQRAQAALPKKAVSAKEASNAINDRFRGDMLSAFKSIDADGSGRLSRDEVSAAMERWSVPMTAARLEELWKLCDVDRDGTVAYDEFATTMTKALFPNPKASGITITGMTTDVVDFDQGYGQVASERFGEKNRIINAKQGLKGKTGDLLGAAARAIDSKMINMRTAFKYLDTDGSRTLSRQEIERGLQIWNVPIDPWELDEMIASCDRNGDGTVEYEEFCEAVASRMKKGAQSGARPAEGGGLTPKPPGKPKATSLQERKKRIAEAENTIHARFMGDMKAAFKFIDTNGDGRLSRTEIRKALDMWNVRMSDAELDDLFGRCVADNEGDIAYTDFVQAMNNAVHGKDMVEESKKVTATGWTTNAINSADEVQAGVGRFGVIASNRFGEAPRILNVRQGIQGKTYDLRKATNRAIENKFKNMMSAFKYIDTDNSNTLSRTEIEAALSTWNIPIDREEVDELLAACDKKGDGEITYDEFLKYLKSQAGTS